MALRMPIKLFAKMFCKFYSTFKVHFWIEFYVANVSLSNSYFLKYVQKIVDEINSSIACFLGLEKKFVEHLRMIVKIMAERRIARTLEAKPEAVKGEEEPRIRPPKKPEKRAF